jgi:hypothetical protein
MREHASGRNRAQHSKARDRAAFSCRQWKLNRMTDTGGPDPAPPPTYRFRAHSPSRFS